MLTAPHWNAIIKNVREYLSQAEEYLNCGRTELPDSNLLLACIPTKSILNMKIGHDETGLLAAVTIKHKEARTPRLFDPWYFVVLLVLEISGARLRFHSNRSDANASKHFYLAVVAPQKRKGIIRVLRIVANSAVEDITGQLPGNHRDYRRATLNNRPWSKGSRPANGRQTAIALAIKLFRQRSACCLTLEEYEQLLHKAFDIADRLHGRLYGTI